MRYYKILSIVLLMPIFAFSLISLTDKDQTVSYAENRNLKKFPEFSAQAYSSGEYCKGIEEYYSDTFPFRDFFLKMHQGLKSVMGFTVGTELVSSQNGSDLGSGENMFEQENPEATPSAPVPSQQSTAENDIVHSNSIIIIDNFAMELYTEPKETDLAYAQSVNRLKQAVGDSVTVYSLVSPTSVEFYSPPKYHEGSSSQKDAIQHIYEHLENVIPVNAYAELMQHTDENLYFRTDHHWTARGAYHAYVAFSKVAGFTPTQLDQMETGTIDGFIGSMYRFTQNAKLKQNPDTLEYFIPPIENESFAYKDATLQNGMPISSVYKSVKGDNKYLAFYGGDSPIIKTVTGNKNGKKILITKESYANAFVPFLLPHYEEVYIVDPRSVKMNLPEFIKKNGIGEVLVLNYTFASSNKTFMTGFNALIP